MPSDRIDLVDEDDAGRVLLALLEHVAHAAGAHAHEHLHEVRAGDREERHVRFARDGAGEQRLAGSRRPDQEHALRDLAAQALEFLRVLQEFDDFLKLGLGLVDAGDILEGHAALLLRQHTRARFPEPHGAAAARLHLAHEEHPDADQQQHREPGEQNMQKRVVAVLGFRDHANAFIGQALHERRVFRDIGLEGAPIGKRTADGAALDDDIAHPSAVHLADEVGVGNLGRGAMVHAGLEQVEQHHQQQCDDDPEGEITAEIAHACSLSLPAQIHASLREGSGLSDVHRAAGLSTGLW